MYIPISIPLIMPQYVRLDRNSQWHTSALLSTALETMTLPSRLRHTNGNSATFDAMEAALNVNGNQRIANLQCSVVDPSVLKSEKSTSVKGSLDRRIPGSNTSDAKEDLKKTTANLDMDFFGGGHNTSVTLPRHRRETAHTFGEVETLRGEFKADEEDDEEDGGFARKRRRLADLPLLEKSVSPPIEMRMLIGYSKHLASQSACISYAFTGLIIDYCRHHSRLEFPLLDSFPDIFTQPHRSTMAVRASLSTTSGVSRRIKDLQKVVSKAVNLDEREALSNGLGEISEAYEEGWQSGSDDESDE